MFLPFIENVTFSTFFTKKRHFKVEKGATCEPALHCQITGTLSDLVTR